MEGRSGARRILFLATGGTFGMARRRGDGPLDPLPLQGADLSFLEPLRGLADLDARVVASIDSSDMTPALWMQLAEIIAAEIDAYDGFVILHGTDTMAYTAAALSFMLQNLPRPVVLTGSQRPMAELRSDADANLVHSTHCAALDLPEVCIYFGESLFRGNRATKMSVQSYSAFASPNHPPLVEMGVDIVARSLPLRPSGPLELRPGFCEDIAALSQGHRPALERRGARDRGARLRRGKPAPARVARGGGPRRQRRGAGGRVHAVRRGSRHAGTLPQQRAAPGRGRHLHRGHDL